MLAKRDAYHVIWDHPSSAEFTGTLRPLNGFLYLDTWGRGQRVLDWKTPPTHLHGFTSDGHHLSAFGFAFSSGRQRGRDEAIRYYDDVISIDRCYAGEKHIVEPNPIIDRFYMQSDDFEALSLLLRVRKEERSILLFENDFVRVDFSIGESWSGSFMETSTKTELGLKFTLSDGVRLDWFKRTWLVPIVSLIELISGGGIHPEHENFCIPGEDLAFCDVRLYAQNRDVEKAKYASVGSVLYGGKERIDLQNAVSRWMEYFNPLRNICHYYSSLYRNWDSGDSSFLTSMRLIEAAYAARNLRDLSESAIPRKNGSIDLRDPDLRKIRKKLDVLKRISFTDKIRDLRDAYLDLVPNSEKAEIDWESCIRAAKTLRHEQAHGAYTRMLTSAEHDQMFALENMGVMFYEACAVEGLGLSETATSLFLKGVSRRDSYITNVSSIWGK